MANIMLRSGTEISRWRGRSFLLYYADLIVVIGCPNSLSRTKPHLGQEKTLEGTTVSSILTQSSLK